MQAGAFSEIRVVQMQRFNLGCPAGAGQNVDLKVAGVLRNKFCQTIAACCRAGRQDGDAPTLCGNGGGFDTVLATVGATAPFVGLLGTVWGIYNALIRIGATGQADIGAVAGPVGEALIMTAIGLGVAIPAVLGYNFFVRLNRGVNAKLDTFAHDLHDFFATGARVGEAR